MYILHSVYSVSHSSMTGRSPLLHLVDLLWSCIIITPLTVLGWRGLWDLLDQVIIITIQFTLHSVFHCFRSFLMILQLVMRRR